MLEDNPLWYKDAIIYEVHVRAFHDLAGDGIGDFRGLTQKLDFLQDLGVTAIWLLPFYPSPLRDDGYDIADYTNIHPDYGTLKDFQQFLDAAHQRGLRVITELVINHTSDQHPWFQRARKAPPGSPERDFYMWSDTPDKYQGVRIIFQDFEHSNWTWDPVAKSYFWHRFYSHQPDLNYDNPKVWEAIFPVVDFWMGMGVDGMRLDAVPYLYAREGTSCENLPETHTFLKALRKHIDERYANRMLLAEANQWPEDAVAYFGDGDESNVCYHFPLMPRMFMSIHMEDRFPIIDIIDQTPEIHETCQWALFLRNHDELTLEMVTDEERDYMYRAYAHDPQARINLGIRRRLAPLLGNNRRRIELMNGLLFSLPGTPIVYYGDEIGMGDNIYLGDRNGVRTPMQWSGDRNAGFSRANPQRLYLPITIDPEYHYEAINVEAQQNNPNSLLWWMKRLLALRKRFKAFGRGTFEFLDPENRRILAFLRRYEDETILVVANLSRFVQYVELDLSEFKEYVPLEIFGRNAFPPIGELPYLLTLGPHSFYWFLLHPRSVVASVDALTLTEQGVPVLRVTSSWKELFESRHRTYLEEILPNYLRQRRWYGHKARRLKGAHFSEMIPISYGTAFAYLTLVTVEYDEGQPETYVLPLTFAAGERAHWLQEQVPHGVIAQVEGIDEGILLDALADPAFCTAMLDAIANNQTIESTDGTMIQAKAFSHFEELRGSSEEPLAPSISTAEQSNTSIIYGQRLILKVFRRVEEGINPDLEIGRYLTDTRDFPHVAPVVGSIDLRRRRRSEPMSLVILQGFVPNQGDAWQHTLDVLSRFYDRALATEAQLAESLPTDLTEEAETDQLIVRASTNAEELIDTYLETARQLAHRTAELHLALASDGENRAFEPERFSSHYQRSLYQSLRNLKNNVISQLRRKVRDLPDDARPLAQTVLEKEDDILRRISYLLDRKLSGMRSRCHGDYHLGQVLHTGRDFIIIDFEGEPARSLSDRRSKRSPLRDVAGMIRSFHYAAFSALWGSGSNSENMPGLFRPEDVELLEPWAKFWSSWVSATFMKEYLEAAEGASFLPHTGEELKLLMDTFILEKAIYELGYELNHRPDWVRIPLMGIVEILEAPSDE